MIFKTNMKSKFQAYRCPKTMLKLIIRNRNRTKKKIAMLVNFTRKLRKMTITIKARSLLIAKSRLESQINQ